MSDTERNYKLMRTIHEHRDRVAFYLNQIVRELLERSLNHDESKFGPEEFPVYAKAIDKFETHHFGTPGYVEAKNSIASATKHHYEHNRHHPEHYSDGIAGMDLVDLIEMLCDWKAATLNHKDVPGNMAKSMEFGIRQYKISPQLAKVLYNTIQNYRL